MSPSGHAPFAALNRSVNPLLGWLLRSPLHRPLSRRLALITYTGRHTGRRHTIPVGYEMAGDQVTIGVQFPERKIWWRNLTGDGQRVELFIDGNRLAGKGVAVKDGDRVAVTVALEPWN